MQMVARAIPTSYIFEGMRGVLQNGQVDFLGLIMAFTLNIVYLVAGILFFVRSYRVSKVTGMLVKFS